MAASDTRAIYGNALILPYRGGETWVIKSDATGELVTTQISFTSNGQKFTSIGANYDDSGTFMILRYDNNEVAGLDIYGGGAGFEFENEAYRKLTFDTPPTGALLTWLQANGVKQPDDTAVQDTKALTITSNGTISVTPDAPYDALKKVDVTVDVASGGNSGETTIVDVYGGGSDITDIPISCIWQTENGWLSTNEFNITNDDYLFSIEDVLVGGYIIFTKDPTDAAFFRVGEPDRAEVLDVNPIPNSSTVVNASIVIKVIEPGCNFRLSINVV